MKCNNCGVKLTPGKRFCPGCGLPVADATAKPAAEEEESVVKLRKRMIELKPFVEAFEKEKEEERKRKEEERKKAAKEAAAASWTSKDPEELFDFDDDDEEDEEFDEEESLEGLSRVVSKAAELEEELTEEEKKEAKRLAESLLEEEKIDEEDELFDSIDVIDIEEEEEERVLNLENLYPSDVYDYMYELDGSEIRMFGYMYFMRIEDDSCIRVDLEDDDSNLSCLIDLNENYTDKSGALISPEELQVILKSFKNNGIMFVSGTVNVEDEEPVILVDSIENCMFGIKKLKS